MNCNGIWETSIGTHGCTQPYVTGLKFCKHFVIPDLNITSKTFSVMPYKLNEYFLIDVSSQSRCKYFKCKLKTN